MSTLIFFTIIITVSMSCIALTYSNNKYSKMQYEHIKVKELALSGIEITKSNILSHIKYAIEEFDKKEDFTNYFLGNSSEIIGNVSSVGLENLRVTMIGRMSEDSNNNINFAIESTYKEQRYIKRVKAKVKIINPWIHYEENFNTEEMDKTIIKSEDDNKLNNINLISSENETYINDDIDNIKDYKSIFDENELVIIYNFEEN